MRDMRNTLALLETGRNKAQVNDLANLSGLGKPTTYIFPDAFTHSLKDSVSILMTDYDAETDFDISDYKNTSTNTWYVDVNTGNDSTGDGSELLPYKTLKKSHDVATSGDTIYLASGIYHRGNAMATTEIKKSLNIIGIGDVALTTSDELTWTQNTTYSNVYEATRSAVGRVCKIDSGFDAEYELEEVGSLLLCSTTDNSWYTNGVTVYVNDLGAEPDNQRLLCLLDAVNIASDNDVQATNLYIENLSLFGGLYGCVSVLNSATYTDANIYGKDLKMFFPTGDDTNVVRVLGCTLALFDNCEAYFGQSDGFNYHSYNDVDVEAIEINCIANKNGTKDTVNNDNGSTMHDGGKIIRIGCNYSENVGANVADVNADTQSVNVCCIAKNSDADNVEATKDFDAQQSGATMWLERCDMTDSTSKYNISAVTGTTLYAHQCVFESYVGSGTKVFTY